MEVARQLDHSGTVVVRVLAVGALLDSV
jgi:hypothetical protein